MSTDSFVIHIKTEGFLEDVNNNVVSLFNNKTVLESQQRFKSNHHDVYTKELNKIALSINDNKRLQTFDRVTTYPYRRNAFKVCENEMLRKMSV